jgi:hypothetical protein
LQRCSLVGWCSGSLCRLRSAVSNLIRMNSRKGTGNMPKIVIWDPRSGVIKAIRFGYLKDGVQHLDFSECSKYDTSSHEAHVLHISCPDSFLLASSCASFVVFNLHHTSPIFSGRLPGTAHDMK